MILEKDVLVILITAELMRNKLKYSIKASDKISIKLRNY
jgi:hypothetical protein